MGATIGKALQSLTGAAMTGDNLVEDMSALAATQARRNAAAGEAIGARSRAEAAASLQQLEAQTEATRRRAEASRRRVQEDEARAPGLREYAAAWSELDAQQEAGA